MSSVSLARGFGQLEQVAVDVQNRAVSPENIYTQEVLWWPGRLRLPE
jgi:hypothetical protein